MIEAHPPDEAHTTADYPTGILTLAGLLIGALIGAALGEMPVGMAAGLAVGVGIDSLLNHWVNGVSAERDARKLSKQ